MKKAELIKEMSERMGMSKLQITILFEEVFVCLKMLLKEGNEISITNFGKFSVLKTNPRKGRNPATGESIDVPSKNKLVFKPSSNFKKYLNKE